MKTGRILRVLALTSALCDVSSVMGSGELVPHQFTNCGITFGRKDIPIEADRNSLSTKASLPTSTAPQRVLRVEHPTYVFEKVFKKVGGQDGRERIEETTEWPHSVFGQLEMVFEGGIYQGSGTLVSPHHVLTCAHNVYDPETQEWAREIKFTPALNENQAPYGVANVVGAYIYEAWAHSGAETADIALVTLAQPIGLKAGWAGINATTDDRALKMAIPTITGYPGDKGGTQMWAMFNRFKTISDQQYAYVIDTYAGQSGSGIWISERGEPHLIGVHTAGNQAQQENIGTRISKAYLRQLHAQMMQTGEIKGALVKPMPSAGGGGASTTSDVLAAAQAKIVAILLRGQKVPGLSDADAAQILAQYTQGLSGLAAGGATAVPAIASAPAEEDPTDAVGQFTLGMKYYNGTGVAQNHKKAVGWIKKAAGQNHADAQYMFARCCELGEGLTQDKDRALRYYGKAAKQGHVGAKQRQSALEPPKPSITIPEIARGHEEVYQRFLRGKLVYKPNKDNNEGRKEFRIADLANPLSGAFDIRGCGDSDKYLSISTGFRTEKNPANKNKEEIWIVPQFVLQNDPQAKPYNDFLQKQEKHRSKPFAILFNYGSVVDFYNHGVTGVVGNEFDSLLAAWPPSQGIPQRWDETLMAAPDGWEMPGRYSCAGKFIYNNE